MVRYNKMKTCLICKKECEESIYNNPCHKECVVDFTDNEIREIIQKHYDNIQ